MSSNVKKILAVALIVIICTALFMFFYGKDYESAQHKRYTDSLNANSDMLKKKLALSDSSYTVLNSKYLTALKQLETQKVNYVNIDKKYDQIADVVSVMPTDDQLRFFADWISKADTLSR